MSQRKTLFFGLSQKKESISIKFGEFGEEVSSQQREFLSDLIFYLSKLGGDKNSKSVLIGCFALPIFGKRSMQKKLDKEGLSYNISRTDNKSRVVIVQCENVNDLKGIISIAWGYTRLVFVVGKENDISGALDLEWIETAEKAPTKVISDSEFIITQFFHGLWLEITTNKYKDPQELLYLIKQNEFCKRYELEMRDEW